MHFLRYIKLGDWLTLLAGTLAIVLLSLVIFQGSTVATKAVIRSGGKIFKEISLSENQIVEVAGPLGISRIEIKNKQVRIAFDPSPRQYCVRQGWLSKAGEIVICLPNQVSVELLGKHKNYDSLNY